eukprot:CAMPEP_0197195940 /NCGR_PEP_ID=MMETSP1423-20130617/32087_1 /TAXON_ID=476441 /ORGANISM="Pseudo-nitzschia heimii, Strain UNC1101" /LENGTH=486 /DNA_ID=CAMNT_0042649703 /DNA_START=474 /DNA_END=1934 /DNA_ORIENTATION=+
MALEDNTTRPHRINFVSPLLDYGYPPAVKDLQLEQRNELGDNKKPILLYLPGFDGTYICPFIQFPELGTEFEVWCMTVGMDDRSTYKELKTVLLDFLKSDLSIDDEQRYVSASRSNNTSNVVENQSDRETARKKNDSLFAGLFSVNTKKTENKKLGRPIYIAGESFGGILASDVALTILKESKSKDAVNSNIDLQGIVLINPATCYDRSQLATAGPLVAKTPFPFYVLGLFSKLVPLFTDEFSLEQLFLILRAKALPSNIDNACREAYMGRVALSLPTKLEFMPPATLSWRLNEWLQAGCAALRDSSFEEFPNLRTLIVVGEKDKTLPSIAEAERLANKVMNASRTKIHVVDGAGHASTCGSRLDLTAVMRGCFPDLQKSDVKEGRKEKSSSKNFTTSHDNGEFAEVLESEQLKRTRMKPEAEQGVGPNFGMQARYDKADIGLNPLQYWSKVNFQSVQCETQEQCILVPQTRESVQYQKSVYSVSD